MNPYSTQDTFYLVGLERLLSSWEHCLSVWKTTGCFPREPVFDCQHLVFHSLLPSVNSSSRNSDVLLWPPWALHTQDPQCIQSKHLYIYNKNKGKYFWKYMLYNHFCVFLWFLSSLCQENMHFNYLSLKKKKNVQCYWQCTSKLSLGWVPKPCLSWFFSPVYEVPAPDSQLSCGSKSVKHWKGEMPSGNSTPNILSVFCF
jgi:hypothetical protein